MAGVTDLAVIGAIGVGGLFLLQKIGVPYPGKSFFENAGSTIQRYSENVGNVAEIIADAGQKYVNEPVKDAANWVGNVAADLGSGGGGVADWIQEHINEPVKDFVQSNSNAQATAAVVVAAAAPVWIQENINDPIKGAADAIGNAAGKPGEVIQSSVINPVKDAGQAVNNGLKRLFGR